MIPTVMTSTSALLLVLTAVLGRAQAPGSDSDTPRDAQLFGLTDADVVEALDGATLEGIDEHDAGVTAATDAAELAEATTSRSVSPWVFVYFDASHNRRLGIRHGITTFENARHAWTQAKTQKWAGGWSDVPATKICVDAGPNTQTEYRNDGTGTAATPIEQFDPVETCNVSAPSLKVKTNHVRNDGGNADGIHSWYTIRAKGCAKAELDTGATASICAPQYSEQF